VPLLSQKLSPASVSLSQSIFARTSNWFCSIQIVIQSFGHHSCSSRERHGWGCTQNSFILPILNKAIGHSNIIMEEIICPYLAILE
jgi:hypothetical protein